MDNLEKIQKRYYASYLILIACVWLITLVPFVRNDFYPTAFYMATLLFLINIFALVVLSFIQFRVIVKFFWFYHTACVIFIFPNQVSDLLQHRSETFLLLIIASVSILITCQDKKFIYWGCFVCFQFLASLVLATMVDEQIISLQIMNKENGLFYFSFDFYLQQKIFLSFLCLIYICTTFFILQMLRAKEESGDKMSGRDELKSDEEMYSYLYKRIIHYFDEHKPYTKHNFKIAELAIYLKTNPNYIARAIKRNRYVNFATFVNLYRINLAKQLLEGEEGKKYTIQYIQMASGFQNQPTFNHTFKKLTGFSPSKYLAHLRKNEMQ